MAEKLQVQDGTKMSVQFKLRLDQSLVTALKDAAERFKRGSGQEVATEILTLFLPIWEQAEQIKTNRIERHREEITREAEEGVRSRPAKPFTTSKAKRRKR